MEVVYSAYYKTLSGDVKKRYDEKIRKCGCDPFAIKKKELSVSPKDFPEITILDIGEYLIHSVSSFTKKKFSAYKSTEAYNYFESGFVLSIGSKKHEEFAILKGRKSVTDFLCKWNIPSFKEESMSFVSNIRFRPKSSKSPALESNFVEYCNSLTPFSDESIDTFIKECHSDGNTTALGSILFPDERRKTNIKDNLFLASLYSANNERKTRRELIEIGKSLSIELSSDDVNEISWLTLPCHKSKCLFALKRGRIISSNFKDCCSTSIANPSISFINRMMNPISNFRGYPKNLATKKKKALAQYFKSIVLDHQELEQYECGLIINPEFPYFAASPDRLINCDCHGEGCVVVKFLAIMETAESFEILTREPNHILNINEDVYELEKTHDFYYQLQLQIHVVELRYCDLVIWSSKPNLGHLILRVNPDIDFWKLHMNKARKFHEIIMMPEILGKSYTRTGYILREDVAQSSHKDKDNDALALEISPSSLYETQTVQETLKGKSQNNNGNSDSFTKINVYNKRNLISASIEEILLTFSDHEDELQHLYFEQIKCSKRNYKAKDLPDMIELDIVSEQQLKAMADLAELRLVKDLEKEHNSTDVIFEAILPEWTLLAFCKTFNLNRFKAIQTLRLQSQLIDFSESEMSDI